MTLAQARLYIHGRLRGLTQRRIERFITAAGASLTRRGASADLIVLAHGSARTTISDAGRLTLGFVPKPGGRPISETAFKRQIGIAGEPPSAPAAYVAAEIERLSGLDADRLRCLVLYDVIGSPDGRFGYEDLVVARAVGRLLAAGATLPRIIAAALAVGESRAAIAGMRLARAPWGDVVQEIEGRLAGLDGQLLLPLAGDNLDADEACRRGEASERAGELAQAERWYGLAARLDRGDPVIRFNLANVLDALQRQADAEIAYRQAIERDPQFADAWFNLGILQERAGRCEEALASYAEAARAEPGYADALHNAATLLMRLSRFGEALTLWERLAAASPDAAAGARRLAHLCRLEIKHAARRG